MDTFPFAIGIVSWDTVSHINQEIANIFTHTEYVTSIEREANVNGTIANSDIPFQAD